VILDHTPGTPPLKQKTLEWATRLEELTAGQRYYPVVSLAVPPERVLLPPSAHLLSIMAGTVIPLIGSHEQERLMARLDVLLKLRI
jgi:hypothetical protein